MWVEIFSIGAATAAVVLVTNYWCNWIYILRKTWRRDLRVSWLSGDTFDMCIEDITFCSNKYNDEQVNVVPRRSACDSKYVGGKSFCGKENSALVRFSRLNYLLWLWERQKKTIPKAFAELVKKHPGKVAFYFEDEVWTYADVDAFSNKIANYFLSKGFKKDDSVSLLLENRPEYLCIWLGLAKIGVVTALINTNLVNDPLVHSIKVSKSKAIIYGEAFSEVVNNVKEKLDDIELYQFNNVESKSGILEGAVELRGNLKNSSEVNVAPLVQKGDPKDNLIYIYTSGTTGLPKAAVIKNLRCIYMVLGIQVMVNFHPDDIVYDALPLYHSAGGMIGAGQTIICGNSTVIRKKFSATNFWKDCAKYKCTVAVYVGELCRYVLAAHDKEEPVKHNVRAIYGNGLKPAIWKQFVEKCKIPEVYELYGATEGNANLISVDSTPGSCGFVPRYGAFLYPITLVRYDESTGEPHRNSKGFCESCKPGEAGILIGKINPKKALHDFTGYADKKASEKKLLFDVFRKGDSYFNSGDVLVQDELGYFYFKDRIGDTFRWKGENVATTEVEAVISNLIELTDAVVYGVEVPGTEGRAGMAALVDINKTLDLEKLAAGFKSNLPAYSIPLFLRVMDTVPLTGTFKLKKRDLQVDGYDVEKVKDDLYFYNARLGKYEKLTKELYHDIVNGKVKV